MLAPRLSCARSCFSWLPLPLSTSLLSSVQCSSPAAGSPSPTTFTLEYPTSSQAVFPNFQSSLPSHTCTEWPEVSRELSLSSPQLAFTALGCNMAGNVQLGRGHSNPCGCAHHVCSTQSFQKAFCAKHCLGAAAFHTWLTRLQRARALWPPPQSLCL